MNVHGYWDSLLTSLLAVEDPLAATCLAHPQKQALSSSKPALVKLLYTCTVYVSYGRDGNFR